MGTSLHGRKQKTGGRLGKGKESEWQLEWVHLNLWHSCQKVGHCEQWGVTGDAGKLVYNENMFLSGLGRIQAPHQSGNCSSN